MKRYVTSALCLVLILFIASRVKSMSACEIDFQRDQMIISGPDGTSPIVTEYQTIRSIALLDSYDAGEFVSGVSKHRLLFGRFRNDAYGEYDLCVNTSIPSAIEIRTNSGVLVFNHESDEVTVDLCDTLEKFIAEKQQNNAP